MRRNGVTTDVPAHIAASRRISAANGEPGASQPEHKPCVDAGVPAPTPKEPAAPVSKYPEIVVRPPGTEPYAAARAAKAAKHAAAKQAAAEPPTP